MTIARQRTARALEKTATLIPMNRDLSLTSQRILFASSEAQSLKGFGDLADFTTTLTTSLGSLDHDVRLVLPAYPALLSHRDRFTEASRIRLPGNGQGARLLQGRLGRNVTLYLVDIPGQFDQPDHADPQNTVRFGLFSRIIALLAVNQAGIHWQPDLLHCNGWKTALAISLLAEAWSRPALVYSMHEAHHQICSGEQVSALSIPVELLKAGTLEIQGRLSFEKGAVLLADKLVLPSAGFRDELLQDPAAHPLAALLKKRTDQLMAIPPGIDYQRWSPTTDPHLEQHYDSSSFALKRLNRQRLQTELALPLNAHDLLIGCLVTAHQNTEFQQIGALLESVAPDIPVHLLIAAADNSRALQSLLDSVRQFPQRISVQRDADESRWHRILASSDCLLLPAQSYPSAHQAQCALSYGTVPIAHATKSIQGTVTDATPANLLHGTASGFLYRQATEKQLADALIRVKAFHAKPAIWWQKLALQGMAQSFHALDTAKKYLQCYQSAIDHPAASPLA